MNLSIFYFFFIVLPILLVCLFVLFVFVFFYPLLDGLENPVFQSASLGEKHDSQKRN